MKVHARGTEYEQMENGVEYELAPLTRFRCCDCGLVHEWRFRVLVDEKKKKAKIFLVGTTHRKRTVKARKLPQYAGVIIPKSVIEG